VSDSIWIAFIGAGALLAGHILNQFFAYKLRIKEFRVSQIQKWIDALEAAEFRFATIPEKNDGEENSIYFIRVLEEFSANATADIWSMYIRHRQIMDPAARSKFEISLENSKTATQGQLVTGITQKVFGGELPKSEGDRLAATTHAAELLTAYEELRATSIDKLYIQLRKEVGVKP